MDREDRKQVKIPLDLREETIAGLYPGTSGYTVHWAMVIDLDGYAYIRGDYSICKKPGGTVCMLVKRSADNKFSVRPDPKYQHRWPLTEVTETRIKEWKLFPVVEIER